MFPSHKWSVFTKLHRSICYRKWHYPLCSCWLRTHLYRSVRRLHNCKGGRGCLWYGFVVTLDFCCWMSASVITSIKWGAISYFDSICQCCETDVWRVKQFLDFVVPFRASICECSSESKRHTQDWVMKLNIIWEHGIETVPACACLCHLYLTLKPVLT